MPKIKIILKKDGTMTTEAEGFRGPSCMAATQKLIQDLNKREVHVERKNEYYANETQTETGA
jgi:valyl-tRNA synthetase